MLSAAIKVPDIENQQLCPGPDSKNKKADDYVESKGVLGCRYSTSLHYAIASLCSVNGALPAHSRGKKALYLLDTQSQNSCCNVQCWCFPRQAWHCIHCCNGRYFLSKDQPMYCWWFYYMWTNMVGPQLNPVLSKLNVKTAADVNQLLDCEVRM